MKKSWPVIFLACCLWVHCPSYGQGAVDLEQQFRQPPASARPWVFWYWMHAAVSKQGITADLEAMKQVGIAGAYLMPIKDTTSPPLYQPVARQLSSEWWQMVHFAMQEAKRLGLQLAMHVSDGFALAGGPWITPELSMQKLVWTKTYLKGGSDLKQVKLEQPASNERYYRDIAVFAYPANSRQAFADTVLIPSVTASNGSKPSFLCFASDGKESFKSDTSCWIEYKYPRPFTCRSLRIHTGGNNYQAQRLIVQASDDGSKFVTVTRLHPPRAGWQDTGADFTYAIRPTTARYFRFVYDKEGSEPGAEDLDAAKWKPSLKVMGIYLSDEPVIHQYESKNASIWRVSKRNSDVQLPPGSYVPLSAVINITGKMRPDGSLNWVPPQGNWVIVRIGHTSTGQTNATGGAGRGLESDKFNPIAVKLQFDNWFAKAFEKTDSTLAKEVLKIFHVDSWECGSQNWSKNFAAEFKTRKGYDLAPYLLAMTGVPLQDAATSENFLHDVRETVGELVNDMFYATLKKLANEKGCRFSAEAIAPTMVSDGLLHYQHADLPMGEFWLNSPTHDKPNDMFDAISGAHIYGRNIVQAEAFTSVRMNWGEHPGMLKSLGDRNFALGINKMVLHVFTHNPWLDRKPGMTLDGVGLYFQRDQTWFKQSRVWIDYLTRCQALLQVGNPVTDIAVFTGEEMPRRALLPDRLVNTLPGIFGERKIAEEKIRLENTGQPLRSIPDGVTHAANMADPEDWIDPLNGYAYDSFNPDVLLKAKVVNGRIMLPGGAGYGLLIIPAAHKLQPDSGLMSLPVARKILQLLNDGAAIMMDDHQWQPLSIKDSSAEWEKLYSQVFSKTRRKGKLIALPYTRANFAQAGISPDLEIKNNQHHIAWTHRKAEGQEIYFVANQLDTTIRADLSFRVSGKTPEIWNAVDGTIEIARDYSLKKGRTELQLTLQPNQSFFIVFRKKSTAETNARLRPVPSLANKISGKWTVNFDTAFGGPARPVSFPELVSWAEHGDTSVKYYAGTAVYNHTFTVTEKERYREIIIRLSAIHNIATVRVNGIDCGTLWTKPYELSILQAVKNGRNLLEIEVTNTWANRLIGDQLLPPAKRRSWTTAPFRLAGKPLLPAGLTGEVEIIYQPR